MEGVLAILKKSHFADPVELHFFHVYLNLSHEASFKCPIDFIFGDNFVLAKILGKLVKTRKIFVSIVVCTQFFIDIFYEKKITRTSKRR